MGFSSNQLNISSLNTTVISRTDVSFVLMDASKYGKCSLVSYADIGEIGGIISNAAPPENIAAELHEKGVPVHLAENA
jgi:DeoR/GlpR family transcriptional regulator of sugar metabolism